MNSSLELLKKQFLLDPTFTYLNHGSFGACPQPIFDERLKWQLELEKQPVSFLSDKIFKLLDWSRDKLSEYVHCDKDDLVYFPNPTTAMNMVIKSLKLNPGDEVLTTNHEYGAIERTWKFMEQKKGFTYKPLDILLPLNKQNFIDEFKKNITKNTKIIFLSHITSPTGIIFPIKKLCELAKDLNLLVIIDGAHAPAHIDLNINELDVDIYIGACHKWMLCPKGVSFLYASKKIQNILDPLVVSWGWNSDQPSHSQFLDYHQYQGTNDFSAFITVPRAIEFLKENKWDKIREHCHNRVVEARNFLIKTLETEPICSDSSLGQMASIQVNIKNSQDLYKYLKAKNIEVPIIDWNGLTFLRISFQCYNSMDDIEFLNNMLKKYLDGI